jgi:hypothetical protein
MIILKMFMVLTIRAISLIVILYVCKNYITKVQPKLTFWYNSKARETWEDLEVDEDTCFDIMNIGTCI